MAKLKGPLLSLGATGQIAKTVVFFPWKGLNAAREYVVPANPRTDAQNTQRSYVTDAVALIHAEMAQVADPITEVDKTAWAAVGSLRATPRTWFNEVVKYMVDREILGLDFYIPTHGVTTPGADSLVISIYDHNGTGTTAKIFYGTSPTALINSTNAALAAEHWTATLGSLTTGVKYYWRLKFSAPPAALNAMSGIYYGTPT